MSHDHNAAIEAGWRAYKNSWTPASPAERCEAAIRAAADVIEADVRRKIAEEIALAIETAPVPPEHETHPTSCLPCTMRTLIGQRDAAIARAAAIARGDSGTKATGGVVTGTPYVIGQYGCVIERGDSGGQA